MKIAASISLALILFVGACSSAEQRSADSALRPEGSPTAAPAGPDNAAFQPGKDGLVRFSAGDTYTYEVTVAPCRAERDCRIVVRLLARSDVRDAAELGWPSVIPSMTRSEPDAHLGAGDSLVPEPETLVWQSGNDAFYVTVAARPVALGGGRIGLLVSQRAGADHPKRRHELFVRDDAKLVKAWSVEEPSGPTWSAANVVHVGDGTDRILYFYGHRAEDSSADSLGVWLVQWDEKSRKATQADKTWPPGVSVGQVGVFPSVQQAQAARDKLANCVDSLWVLKASDYGVQGQGYLLGGLTSNPQATTSLRAKAQACDPNVAVSVLPYRER